MEINIIRTYWTSQDKTETAEGRKERKQGIKGNMRREESMDLAKRGSVHMNHSRETLDSSPGSSVQFVYVFL